MLKRLMVAFLITGAVLVSLHLYGQEETADVDALMKNFFAASTDKEKSHAISLIRFSGVDAADIEARLRKGRDYAKDVKTGWQVLYNECPDGVKRPYHLYVPEDYDPTKKYPVFYDLHGGVSRPSIVPIERLIPRRGLWGPLAKEKGFILLIPHGERAALWWNKTGTDNVLDQLDYVKHAYNVDENKAFLSGFSDGASGSYWMGLHRPTSWAGFVPLSGNMLVPRAGPYQCYPRNFLNRPIHATNGGRDSLYPAAIMKKLIDQMKELGIHIDWTDYPEAGHDMSYFKTEMPRVMEFVEKTSRTPLPSKIIWETADPEAGRCDWVQIDEIKDIGNNHEFKDVNLISPPGRLLLGVVIDQQYAGPGVRIQQVQKDSLAHKAGLTAGDVITKLDDTDVNNMNDLRSVLSGKKHGDKIEGDCKRGDEVKHFSGQFPEAKSEPAYRREKPAGLITVEVHGNTVDVKVRNVAKYTLLVSSEMFDLREPILVLTNGKEAYGSEAKRDLVFMLEQAARDNDRTTVYCAKIEITVPAKGAEDESKEQEEKPEEEGK